MMMSCSLHSEVHALFVLRSKLLHPVAFLSSSQAFLSVGAIAMIPAGLTKQIACV